MENGVGILKARTYDNLIRAAAAALDRCVAAHERLDVLDDEFGWVA